MCILRGIDIDVAVTVLRGVAGVLAVAALVCLSRVGSGWLAGGFCVALAGLAAKLNGATLTALDTSAQSWLAANSSHRWKVDARALYSYLGQPVHFAVVVVFCATLLALHARSSRRGALVIAIVGTGVLVEETLKAAIARSAGPLMDYSHGFPSGHVTACAAFLGMVAVCLGVGRSLATQAALATAVMSGVLVVGVLALYSGAHTVTDILGGMVLGGALVALGAAIVRASLPKVRLPHAANVAVAMTAHTAPLRTRDIRFERGY